MIITGNEQAVKHGVRVESYGPAEAKEDNNRIIGYIEPAVPKPQWIMWFTEKGDAMIYTERNYKNGDNGAVVGEPIRLKAIGKNKAPFQETA